MLCLDVALPVDNEVVFSLKDNSPVGGILKTGRDLHSIRYCYDRNQRTSSVKSQILSIVDFLKHAISVAIPQISHFNAKLAIDNIKMNG